MHMIISSFSMHVQCPHLFIFFVCFFFFFFFIGPLLIIHQSEVVVSVFWILVVLLTSSRFHVVLSLSVHVGQTLSSVHRCLIKSLGAGM